MEDRFNNLSALVNDCLKTGNYNDVWTLWEEMAKILYDEKRYVDELKVLMLEFHMYLERENTIWLPAVMLAKKAVENSKLSSDERFRLYTEIAFDNFGNSAFSCENSFKVFECCIDDRIIEAYEIIDKVIQNSWDNL